MGATLLVACLGVQLSRRAYVPWVYWTTVTAVSIFGTMSADFLNKDLGMSVAAAETERSQAQLAAETEFDVTLVEQEAAIEAARLEVEQRRELVRIRHEGERRLEQARAEEILAERRRIDGEFAARREAELRRRAEDDHEAWSTTPDRGTGFGAPRRSARGSAHAVAVPTRWGRRRRG